MSDEKMAEGFENARKGLRETGASVWGHHLVDLLAHHGEEEGVLLTEYERLTGQSSSSAARYLGQLIVDDEHRHHRMLVEIANAAAWGMSELSPEPAVPPLEPPTAADARLAAATRTLLDLEKRDHHELKDLRRELKPVSDTTLWALLVDLMLLDTEKHLRILRFLDNHLNSG